MGMFDFFRRRPPTPPRPTGPVSPPVDQVSALAALGQSSFDVYHAPLLKRVGPAAGLVVEPEATAGVAG